jgi:hypothetical protein
MRGLRNWGLAAALFVGCATCGLAASDDGDDAGARPAAQGSSGSWLTRWLGSAPAKAPKPDKAASKAKATPRPALVADDAATVRAREEAALLRRMEVCIKLKQIAEQTGDADLHQQADQLDERCSEVYRRRITNLAASHASAEDAEHFPEKHTWSEAAPVPLPHVVPGEEAQFGAAARGEK